MASPPACRLCLDLATAFYLKGKQKLVCCQTHVSDVLSKGTAVYPIEAFAFIDSPADLSAFEARKEEAARIKAYIQILISSVGEERKLAMETLDKAKGNVIKAITAAFCEALETVSGRHNEVVTQLETLETALQSYLTNRDAVLPEAGRLLSKATTVLLPSFIHLTIAEPLLSIASEVLQNISISSDSLEHVFQVFDRKRPLWNLVSPAHQIAKVRFRHTTEVQHASLCKRIGLEGTETFMPTKIPTATPHHTSSDKEAVVYRFKRVWEEGEVIKLGRELCEKGRVDMWNEDFEVARAFTEKAISIFVARTPQSRDEVICYLQLGRILHLGLVQLDEAQKMYQHAFLICKEKFPTSELIVDAYASLAGLFASKGLYTESELHLANGLALALEYIPESMELAKVYRAYGYLKRQKGDFHSSLMCDTKALKTSEAVDSYSWDVLLSHISVGCDFRDLNESQEAEQSFLRAAAFSPSCAYSVRALLHLGKMYIKQQRPEDAESILRRAIAFGRNKFPRAKSTAQVQDELTQLQDKSKRSSRRFTLAA